MNTFAEIFYPELVTDVQEIYWDTIDKIGKNTMGSHIKSVMINKENPEHYPLCRLYKKYESLLAPHFLMIHMTPNYTTPIHLDGAVPERQRATSFNIPIQGCNSDCITEFFDIPESAFWTDYTNATRFLKDGITGSKIGEYRLTDNPFLVCPQTPHRVNNLEGSVDRITVSWSLRRDWTFQQAVNFFKEQDRLVLN
jgi:hypothetical protein